MFCNAMWNNFKWTFGTFISNIGFFYFLYLSSFSRDTELDVVGLSLLSKPLTMIPPFSHHFLSVWTSVMKLYSLVQIYFMFYESFPCILNVLVSKKWIQRQQMNLVSLLFLSPISFVCNLLWFMGKEHRSNCISFLGCMSWCIFLLVQRIM